MTVVTDTSPLNYLVQIENQDLLQRLYGRVLVPHVVVEELRRGPLRVRSWCGDLPPWVSVQQTSVPPGFLRQLHPGERGAIYLASQGDTELLLIDERKGFAEASKLGIHAVGTIGVLLEAAEAGYVNTDAAFRRLFTDTNFRVSAELRSRLLG